MAVYQIVHVAQGATELFRLTKDNQFLDSVTIKTAEYEFYTYDVALDKAKSMLDTYMNQKIETPVLTITQ